MHQSDQWNNCFTTRTSRKGTCTTRTSGEYWTTLKSGKTEGGEEGDDSPWFQWWSTERSLIWYAVFKAWMVKSILLPFYTNVRHKWYCFSWETVTSNTKGYVRSCFRYAIFLRGLGGGGGGGGVGKEEGAGRHIAYQIRMFVGNTKWNNCWWIHSLDKRPNYWIWYNCGKKAPLELNKFCRGFFPRTENIWEGETNHN